MKTVLVVLAAVVSLLSGIGLAQAQSDEFKLLAPPHYRSLVEMADCKTVSCLVALRKNLPKGEKMTDLVFFSREMELQPNAEAAASLLHATPSDVREQMMFINFPTWHDEVTKTEHDMIALGHIYDHWPQLTARAALLGPDSMLEYVRYLRLASNDIHSDFTGQAEVVCRKQHAAFVNAFAKLSEGDRAYIEKYVFHPTSCEAIFRSEAE